MSYKVKLQTFEGPFDLLVYLIENAQMSIYDIEISSITAQYLDYLDDMKEMDIAVSSEFMVLASSLIEIKSKMILPRISGTGEELLDEDPRKELVARLLEYKKFKQAAELLRLQEEREQNVFRKPQEDISCYLENPDEYLDMDMERFINAFSLFIERKHRIEAVRRNYARVEREKATVENRIKDITAKLRAKAGRVFSFKELVPEGKSRYDVVVTFISLLEMAKERVVKVKQKTTYGNIEVAPGERINEGDIKYEQ